MVALLWELKSKALIYIISSDRSTCDIIPDHELARGFRTKYTSVSHRHDNE